MQNLLRAVRGILRGKTDPGVTAEGPAASRSAWALLESAFRLQQSGNLADAASLYRQAVALDPTSDVAYNLLGGLLCGQGRLAEGEACFRSALDLNPSNVEALSNLASARKDQGDLQEAEDLYRRALAHRPDFHLAWNNLGLVHVESGRLDEAAQCFRRTLGLDKSNADAHSNLGAVLRMQGKIPEAENEFRTAIAANPALAEAWSGLGDVLQMRSLLAEAAACCRKALELRPDFPDAMNNLATIAKKQGDLDLAEAHCRDALRVRPNHLGALTNLGTIAARRADHGRAESMYRKALAIDPNRPASRYNLATTLLMLGNYQDGFELYESRFEALSRPYARSAGLDGKLRSRPRWRGDSPPGNRLLVWSEQGLGDCIMMLRYLPELRARGAGSVAVLCDPSLGRIVASMSAVEQVVTDEEEAESIDFDAHCPMMSLPREFGTRIETVPNAVPYLAAPESMVAAWKARLTDARPKVGLVWAGSRTLEDDARRSIPLETFTPLLSINGVEFISLQKGDAGDEWGLLGRDGGQWIEACSDLLDTAALIANLDLVISVDTAVAHLSGALGKPVWLLNRFGSEWRWGVDCARTPWYPTMQIVHESGPGHWRAAVQRAAAELGQWAGQ
ncbi:MAG TPA: tetratricopeptide repeat protein [Casimicrobiaceae bacterium]|nr:tetratricopeptide repeat protein [Casimicrobiaceae bacterium]